MFAKGLILALLATSFTSAINIPEAFKIRILVELAYEPLWREVTLSSTNEFIKIVTSGIGPKEIAELNNQVVQLTKNITKEISDSKEALVVSLKEAAKEGDEKFENATEVALENIEKAQTDIKLKYEELAERIDESIKKIKESRPSPPPPPPPPHRPPHGPPHRPPHEPPHRPPLRPPQESQEEPQEQQEEPQE